MTTSWTTESICDSNPSSCLFGSCEYVNNLTTLTCVCSANYADNVFFVRINDCSLPTDLYLATMGVSVGIGALTILLAMFRTLYSTGESRLLVILFGVAALNAMIASLFGLFQGGTGRGFFFFLWLSHFAIFFAYGRLVNLFIETTSQDILFPRRKSTRNIIDVLLTCLMFTCPLPMFALMIISFALGDEANPAYPIKLWNVAFAVNCTLLVGLMLIFGTPLTLIASSDMLAQINSAKPRDADVSGVSHQLRDVKRRILIFRYFAGVIFPVVSFVSLILCVTCAYFLQWPVLGYISVVILVTFNVAPIVLLVVLTPLSKPRKSSKKSVAVQNSASNNFSRTKWGRRVRGPSSKMGTVESSFHDTNEDITV